MEIETAQIGIALASYVAGIASNWWWQNRKKVLGTIEETLEDKIEELTGGVSITLYKDKAKFTYLAFLETKRYVKLGSEQ